MTYPDAIMLLYDLRWFGAKLGLRLRFIRVAGTNGEGSMFTFG